MKLLFSFLVSLATVSATLLFAERSDDLFVEFKQKFGKRYEDEEEIRRKVIFHESMKRVDEKNRLNGSPSFGVTKFSDLTLEEFSVFLGRADKGVEVPESKRKVRDPAQTRKRRNLSGETPTDINWNSMGKVTPVKNQGQCGSCWAFSTAEAVESAWAMEGNALWEFSVQQVASCVDSCYGCGGGDTVGAYEYFMNNSQAVAGQAYAPYIQSMYESCNGKRCTESCGDIEQKDVEVRSGLAGPYATIIGYEYATPPCYGKCDSQDMELLAENVGTSGPASICVNAENWNDYTGGVLTQAACGGYSYLSVDHCVHLTGYNTTAETPYWIVKNSWATNWGENGYIYLEYGKNTCALADEATFVTLGN